MIVLLIMYFKLRGAYRSERGFHSAQGCGVGMRCTRLRATGGMRIAAALSTSTVFFPFLSFIFLSLSFSIPYVWEGGIRA